MREYAGVILIKKNRSVLAQHRDNNPEIFDADKWGIVGGAREEGERLLRKTAVRELKEETGYLIAQRKLNYLDKEVYLTDKGIWVKRTIFTAAYDGIQDIGCNEGQEIRFFSPEELNELTSRGEIAGGHERFFALATGSAKAL